MKAVDLFAGWGGFTTAAQAAGVDVVWAANHWKLAVDTHAANHPTVEHVCQDLRQADWTTLPNYDLLLASPACQGHSTASQPKRRRYHDEMRATAWAVIDCMEVTEPRLVIVENVPSMRRWPLFDVWKLAMTRLGYKLTENLLIASRQGVPQRRERLFLVASRRRPIFLENPLVEEPAFGPCIDWEAPGWRPVSRARPEALKRIRGAQARSGRTCLVQHVTNHPGVPLDQPIRTITAKDQWIIVDGNRYRPLTIRELARGMSFPEEYTWQEGLPRWAAIRGIGNAVCPRQGRDVIEQVQGAA